MSVESIHVEGRLYVSLEVVAELYEVKSVLLREAYDCGLLGTGVDHERTLCIAAVQLERVATIVQLHQTLGLGLEAITERLG